METLDITLPDQVSKTETMDRGAQSSICGNQWLPPSHPTKDGRDTDSCFALIGAHQCGVLMVIVGWPAVSLPNKATVHYPKWRIVAAFDLTTQAATMYNIRLTASWLCVNITVTMWRLTASWLCVNITVNMWRLMITAHILHYVGQRLQIQYSE